MYENEPLDPNLICIICGFNLTEYNTKPVTLRNGHYRKETTLSSSIQRRDVEITEILRCSTKLFIHCTCEQRYNNPRAIEADLKRKEIFGESNLAQLLNAHDGLEVKPDFFKTCLLCESDASFRIEADEDEKLLQSKEIRELRNIRSKLSLLNMMTDWSDYLPEHIVQRIQLGLKVVGARFHRMCLFTCEKLARSKTFDFEKFLTTVSVEKMNSFLEENANTCYSLDELVETMGLKCNIEKLKQEFQLKYGKTYYLTKTEPTLICTYNTAGNILKQWKDYSISNPLEEKMETVGLAAEIILEDLELSTNTLQNGTISLPESLSLFVKNLIECNNDSDSVETIAKALLTAARSELPESKQGFTNQVLTEPNTEDFLLDSLCDNLI